VKPALLLCVFLIACRPPEAQVQHTKGNMELTERVNQELVAYFSGPEFKAFDAQEVYGPDIQGTHTLGFVSSLSREQVREQVSAIIDPYVEDQVWADDYGQLHGSFVFKGAPDLRFGVGIGILSSDGETFKNHPELLKGYQTDIVYTQPFRWEPQQ